MSSLEFTSITNVFGWFAQQNRSTGSNFQLRLASSQDLFHRNQSILTLTYPNQFSARKEILTSRPFFLKEIPHKLKLGNAHNPINDDRVCTTKPGDLQESLLVLCRMGSMNNPRLARNQTLRSLVLWNCFWDFLTLIMKKNTLKSKSHKTREGSVKIQYPYANQKRCRSFLIAYKNFLAYVMLFAFAPAVFLCDSGNLSFQMGCRICFMYCTWGSVLLPARRHTSACARITTCWKCHLMTRMTVRIWPGWQYEVLNHALGIHRITEPNSWAQAAMTNHFLADRKCYESNYYLVQ